MKKGASLRPGQGYTGLLEKMINNLKQKKSNNAKEVYRSRVYTERPDYADFDAPAKFTAIQSIIAKRLIEHPNAICSYSGGSDSDIMLDIIERTREIFDLPPIKYVFF